MDAYHHLHRVQTRLPAGLKPFQDGRFHQPAQVDFVPLFIFPNAVVTGAVACHGHPFDDIGYCANQVRVCRVQVVSFGGQARVGKTNRFAVWEPRLRPTFLHEASVAADADFIGQREQDIRVETFCVNRVGPRPLEKVAKRADSVVGEGSVMLGESHHQVVHIPQAVVDGGGGEQHEVFAFAAHHPRHRPVPSVLRVAQGVALVH